MSSQAIGIFDSGVGGLTVFKALAQHLPHEHLVYLGDSARVPYGTKSSASVKSYAEQASRVLVNEDIKMLVIACNTATAVALEHLQAVHRPLPVLGVIEPGARLAVAQSQNQHIGVIATEGTIAGKAYDRALLALNPRLRLSPQACSLFVALAEDGWLSGPLLEQVLAHYLAPIFPDKPEDRPDTLVLGCTHFPLLKHAIAQVLGSEVRLIDSAEAVALDVAESLARLGLLNRSGQASQQRFLVTDGVERFARVGSLFLGRALQSQDIELVDL